MLISDIKTNGIHALSSPSFPKKERFNLIMETACQYLDITTKEAAYFLSFFPGSFDKDVILFSTFEDFRQSINILFERSLLESYTVSPSLEVRYKFHKLIREYFQQKILTEFNSKDKWRFVFQKEFVAYYTNKFSKYFTSSNSISSLSLENQLFLSTEQHNLRYLASIIVKNVEFTSEEKIVVVFAYMQGVMQSNQSGIILNMIIELVEQNNTKFIDVCFSNDTNMCKDLVFDLIHSAAVATDTSYAHLPCNTLKKITLDKWTFITDVSVQNLLDNSQMYCLQNENVIILKYVFFFMFSIFYWSKNFHNYKVLLCASREYDPDDFFFYYFTLPFVVYLLKNYPVYILCFSILFVCYFVNICTGLYLCLFYLNYLWLYYIDTIIRYFLSLDGNGAIWLKRWCYLCINFTSANSDWIFYTVNSIFCAIIIPGIPIVIAVMGSYFISTQYVIYYFHSFLYRLNRNN